uniref:Cytochrome b5 heme-binding domain-containing protein n=1 Tax=Caenorhabditis tropicalis TaxID=1561998 RepID=A0A1I7URG0_9PELO
MSALPIITLEEVAKHNLEDEEQTCWIIISGKVYDVTSFLQEHPGGEEVITQLAGMDSTQEFLDVGHSKDAVEMANEYLIGQLPEDQIPEVAKPVVQVPKGPSAFQSFLASPTLANILIPTGMGIGIYIVYKLISRPQRV